MTVKLQIIVGICLFLALTVIVYMIKKRSLDLKYALSWLLALVFVLVLDLFPVLLTKLSMALGVWAPVNMIFFLGFCFSLLIIFTLTVMLSRMAERVRKLAQAVAMNEEKLDRMGRELKKLQEEKEESMKILMIGLGSIGQRHLRNIKRVYGEEAQILAYRVRGLKRTFSDTMQIRENVSLEEEYNIKSFDDLSKALLEKPDIAYITNITKSHIPCAIACAKAGCHLFLEKPISDSLDGIEELAKIAAEKKLKVFVGYQNRFHPGIQYLKQFLAEGSIGRILSVRSVVGERLTTMHTYENYKDTYMARKDMGGGVLLNQMVHELDYLYYLFGQPKSVYALGGINGNLGIDVEDNLDAIYRYESEQGTFPVSVHADFYQYPPSRFVKVVGEKGHIIVDLLKAEVTQAVGDEVTVIPYPDFARNDMFIEELKLFIDCIREDTEPAIPLADGIVSLKMALAARKSMETGGVIDEFTGTV